MSEFEFLDTPAGILVDPFYEDDAEIVQHVEDKGTFTILAKSLVKEQDYSASVDQKDQQTVMRLGWLPPRDLLVSDTDSAPDSHHKGYKIYGDVRGRLVAPLGFRVEVHNVSDNPLKWHVNSPYQRLGSDGVLSSRVRDSVIVVPPRQRRSYAHAWTINGMEPYTGSIGGNVAVERLNTYRYLLHVLADFFIVGDKYSYVGDSAFRADREVAEVFVSVRYRRNPTPSLDAITEKRKPIVLGFLNSLSEVYHVDPDYGVGAFGAGPKLTYCIPPKGCSYLTLLNEEVNGAQRLLLVGCSDAVGNNPTRGVRVAALLGDDGWQRMVIPNLIYVSIGTSGADVCSATFSSRPPGPTDRGGPREWVLDRPDTVLKTEKSFPAVDARSPAILFPGGSAGKRASDPAGPYKIGDKGVESWATVWSLAIRVLTVVASSLRPILTGGSPRKAGPKKAASKKRTNPKRRP